jgi:hypothetical protein
MDKTACFEAITIGLPHGQPVTVATAANALQLLTEDWPEPRGPRHRDAVDTCLKVIDGHRSSQEVRRALVEAAAEAGYRVS